ncbi:MAG: ParA family protein [Tepidisphaeraceae bacterium]
MRVIAMMNQKGGVGKTTTTVNLGAALAEMGARVLLLDLDPQSHLTINFGVEPGSAAPNLYDVICGDASFAESLRAVDTKTAVAPGAIDLAGTEIELSGRADRAVVLRNKMLTAQQAGALDFDYVLFDCPPSLGLLTLNALAVAGEVMIPMQPHFLAMQGMAKLFETVQLVNRNINPRLRVSGVILTMFDAQTKLSSEVVGELEGFLDASRGQPVPWSEARVCRTKVRRNIKLAESPSFGQPVLKYDSASNGSTDYRALAREVATMRSVPSALDKTSLSPSGPAKPKSLLESAIESVERQVQLPKVEATVNPHLDSNRLAAAHVAETKPV